MGSGHIKLLLLSLILLQFLGPNFALPLCTNSRAPFTPESPLQFCPYNGTTCCNSADDVLLKTQLETMNVSDPACASALQSILCARCDPFSAELFRIDGSVTRAIPVLCNSTMSENSTQSTKQAQNNFCSQVWTTCQNVYISHSPFTTRAGPPVNAKSTKLTDLWRSGKDFCDAVGGLSDQGLLCYIVEPVKLNNTTPSDPLTGICLEKIANGSYLNMVPHPDGSTRAFFSNLQGMIWMASVPEEGSGQVLNINEADPFLDLTDEVHFDTEFGMMGVVFHPKFRENGRLFVSFNCDRAKWPSCAGRCACNSDANCDPSKLGSTNGARTCQYHSVIAEFNVNSTTSRLLLGAGARPSEVRRIFTMGLPFTAHHGGQIVFGPRDGYLYFMMGDGGSVGDPYNFAQNKKSLLGKVMRFDVDNIPSPAQVSQLGLWGTYSIPTDNPYVEDKELRKEIWALGLRNPWGCSFDSARPPYFVCADVGQDQYEEVNLVTRGGNYGWRVYEGRHIYNPSQLPGGNTSLDSMRPIFPVMGYNHSEVNSDEGSASITGGYFYRSMTDPCLHGRYLFGDLYAGAIWVGTECPINSGNFTSGMIAFNCAHDSPLNCTFTPGNSLPDLGIVVNFGEDNKKDVYILTNNGVYRIARPSRCNYTCAKESASSISRQGPRHPLSEACLFRVHCEILLVCISLLWLHFVNFVI